MGHSGFLGNLLWFCNVALFSFLSLPKRRISVWAERQMREFTSTELLSTSGFLLRARVNGNSGLSQSDPPKASVGGMGGVLTSGGDSWGKRMGEGMPRCAREGNRG